jgi:hypothetical protein
VFQIVATDLRDALSGAQGAIFSDFGRSAASLDAMPYRDGRRIA